MSAILLAAAIAGVGQAQDSLAMARSFLRQNNLQLTYSVDVNQTRNMFQGTMRIARPNRFYARVTSGREDYELLVTPAVVREVEHRSKFYHEWEFPGVLVAPPSEIASSPDFGIPHFVLQGDLSALLPPGTSFERKGTEKIDNRDTERYHAAYQTPMGSGEVELFLDAQGRPWRLQIDSITQAGRRQIIFHFKTWETRAPATRDFQLNIPVGYVPAFIYEHPDPARVDQPFPATRWSAASGTIDPLTDAPDRTFILFLVAEKCAVTDRAKTTFERIGRAAASENFRPYAGVARATATSRPVLNGMTNVFDRSGDARKALRATSTPMIFLVHRGVLRRAWMGFDPDKASQVEREVADAIRRAKAG